MSGVIARIAAGEKFSVANSKRGHITVDGLANMIGDLRKQGKEPEAILLSHRDRIDLNDDLMAMSKVTVAKADANNKLQIGCILGVLIGWNRHVQNGKCIVNLKAPAHGIQEQG